MKYTKFVRNQVNFSGRINVYGLESKKERFTMKTLLILFIASGFLLMAGCQPVAISAGNPTIAFTESIAQKTATSIDNMTQTPSPESGNENKGVTAPDKTMTPDANAKKLILLSKENLASQFKINMDDIYLSSAIAVVWPDASLGCPQPDKAYAQVMTPGYSIVLKVAEKEYPYHTDGSTTVILCPEGGLPEFLVTPGEIQDGKPWMPVP
jgi:hypothetical protein